MLIFYHNINDIQPKEKYEKSGVHREITEWMNEGEGGKTSIQ